MRILTFWIVVRCRRKYRYALKALKFADVENNLARRGWRGDGGGRCIDLLLVSTLVSMAMLRWPPRSIAAPASGVIGFLVTIKALFHGISPRLPTRPLKGTPTTSSRLERDRRSCNPIVSDLVAIVTYLHKYIMFHVLFNLCFLHVFHKSISIWISKIIVSRL